jgi:hypothetical protein
VCREVQREVQILATGVTKAKSHHRCGRVLWVTTLGVVPRSSQILKYGKMAKKNTDSQKHGPSRKLGDKGQGAHCC